MSIHILKNVSFNEHIFQGHFPENPVMPALLTTDTALQALSLCLMDRSTCRCPSFSRIEVPNGNFLHPIVPGDQMKVKITVGKCDHNKVHAHVQVFVAERMAAELDFVVIQKKEMDLEPTTRPSTRKNVSSHSCMACEIHPTAHVHPEAKLADGVVIGPYTVISEKVTIGEGTKIGSHCVVKGNVEIGKNNSFAEFCILGKNTEITSEIHDTGNLVFGDNNIVHQFCTFSLGSAFGNNLTLVGNNNFILNRSHVAHDCVIGNWSVLSAMSMLSGHVQIGDNATIGGMVGVHQFCRIGEFSFVGGYSKVVKDVAPFSLVASREGEAKCYGLNKKGLRRAKFPVKIVEALNCILKEFMRRGEKSLLQIQKDEDTAAIPEAVVLIDFLRTSSRGVTT